MKLKKTYESWKRLQESVRPERVTGIAYPERLRRAFESAADHQRDRCRRDADAERAGDEQYHSDDAERRKGGGREVAPKRDVRH